MSAPSGIAVSDNLLRSFNAAIKDEQKARFIIATICNESIELEQTVEPCNSLEDDLIFLQDILESDKPAYILTKLDSPSNSWLAISYIPDNANIRAKMLYAASRASLGKGLGSGYFVDSLFATSLTDLTAESYKAHLAHNAAPKPLSEREREIEEAKAAEKSADPLYEGSRARKSHVNNPVGFQWEPKAEEALQSFVNNRLSELIILTIDVATEVLTLHSQSECSADEIGSRLPDTEAAYALYRWKHDSYGQPKDDVVFIYSCPATSPVKLRMLYSSGVGALVNFIKEHLRPEEPIVKRIELADPKEFSEDFIREELGFWKTANDKTLESGSKLFARPRGPIKKRQ